jgi:hypothetical protein
VHGEVVVADELLDDLVVAQPDGVGLAHGAALAGGRVAVEGAGVVEVDDEAEADSLPIGGGELIVQGYP